MRSRITYGYFVGSIERLIQSNVIVIISFPDLTGNQLVRAFHMMICTYSKLDMAYGEEEERMPVAFLVMLQSYSTDNESRMKRHMVARLNRQKLMKFDIL